MNRFPAVRVGAVLFCAGVVLVAMHGRASAEGVADPTPVSLPASNAATLPTLPPLPTTPSTASAPAPVPSLPTSPSSLPGVTSPPGGSTGTQDPCADAGNHATESGAPIAASCPLTQTRDGGGDGALCVDVALTPSCASTKAVSTSTTTTIASTMSATTPSVDDPSELAAPATDSAPTNTVAVEAAATTKKGGGSLPFTGGEVAGLATLGALLAGCGLALARSARNRSF